jgi:hypothetical protein
MSRAVAGWFRRDRSVLGRLHTADGDAGGEEPGGQGQDARGAGGEAGMGQPEQSDAEDQD